MRILVVDDSKAMRMIVIRTLRQAGYPANDIDQAGNGLEALESIRAGTPDLVLCDWNMPEMNGIELLRTLRANSIDVPFGFVTSETSPEMRQQAEDAGAQFLIGKPFDADTFADAIGGLAA